jgi:hypothetical protein
LVQFSRGTDSDRDRGNLSSGEKSDRLKCRPYQIPHFFKESGI